MPDIRFFSQIQTTLANKTILKDFLAKVFKKEKQQLHSLHYIFCSDDALLQINKDFLDHDYYTDIITFNLADDTTTPIEGEIYISVERIKDNAQLLGVSFKEELHRVMFHGALHLCGYKDKLKAEKYTMRQAEDRLLSLYFQKK